MARAEHKYPSFESAKEAFKIESLGEQNDRQRLSFLLNQNEKLKNTIDVLKADKAELIKKNRNNAKEALKRVRGVKVGTITAHTRSLNARVARA